MPLEDNEEYQQICEDLKDVLKELNDKMVKLKAKYKDRIAELYKKRDDIKKQDSEYKKHLYELQKKTRKKKILCKVCNVNIEIGSKTSHKKTLKHLNNLKGVQNVFG
jgi:hypothetical protein